jgi:hypothetical protein
MNFNACIEFTLRCEGGFSITPEDRGNWTGGEIGVGILKGTNLGYEFRAFGGRLSVSGAARPQRGGGGGGLSPRLLAEDQR